MRLSAGIIRKRVENPEGGRTELEAEPGGGCGFLLNDGEAAFQELFHVLLLSGLRFERDQKCNFDHDVLSRMRRLRRQVSPGTDESCRGIAQGRAASGVGVLANVIPARAFPCCKMPPRGDKVHSSRGGQE